MPPIETQVKEISGLDTLRWFEAKSGRLCLVSTWNSERPSPGKNPDIGGKGWQDKPLTADQVTKHFTGGGNVGLICGKHSAGICLLDVDEDFSQFCEFFPWAKNTPAIIREGADKGKLIIRIVGDLPEPKKFKHNPTDKHPFFEFLASGNQGVIAGTNPAGAGIIYRLINGDRGIPEFTAEDVSNICASWTGQGLEDNEPKTPEMMLAYGQHEYHNGGGLLEAVKAAWPTMKVFEHWNRVSKTRLESRGEWLRLFGNGGLFVRCTNGQPDNGWSIPGEKIGGGPFEAWWYCKTGSVNVPKKTAFYELLCEMAKAGNVPIPEHTHQEEAIPPEPEFPPVEGSPEPPARKKTSWSLDELYETEFPEPEWSIPGYIPMGLVLLGGRPKVGKSWLLMLIAFVVAVGGMLFGAKVKRRKVLYIAYEDNPRRIKDRCKKMGIPKGAPIQFEFTWKPLHAGGLNDLLIAIEGAEYGLVVIDTLSRSIPGVDQNDPTVIGPLCEQLQRMAIDHNMTILPADHTRKPNGIYADPIDDIMSATAKSATADAVLAIYKEQGKAGANLRGRGKDIEEIDLALTFDPLTGCWQSEGNASELKHTEAQNAILEYLQTEGKAQEPTISKLLGKDRGNVYKQLQNLVNDGKVRKEKIEGKVYYEAIQQ